MGPAEHKENEVSSLLFMIEYNGLPRGQVQTHQIQHPSHPFHGTKPRLLQLNGTLPKIQSSLHQEQMIKLPCGIWLLSKMMKT